MQDKGSCSADNLAAPNTPNPLTLGSTSWSWQVKSAGSCSTVNLVSRNRAKAGKPAFLSVPNTCDKFAWGSRDSAATRFKLKKRA